MEHEEFMALCGAQLEVGQRMLASSMRQVMALRAPELYEHIAEADDSLFLEPLLFAHVSKKAPVESLPQLILGALPPDQRPDAIDAFTDGSGLLDVPGIGYFHTELAEAALLLSWDRATDRYTLRRPDESSVAYRFEPRLCVPGTNIDIQRYAHPLLDPLILDTADQLVAVDPVPATVAHAGSLARAFALLAEVDPTYRAHIAGSTRRVMLFHERPRVYSFASIAAHGIAFFSTQPNDDEVFFLEDICHQCAHVVFNAVTVRRGDYLHVDPDLKMAELTGDQRDPRKLYSAFHALYTYYNIMRVLQRCERKILSTRAAHELHGRIAFTASNYRADIQTMDRDLYMPQGRLYYEQFKRACDVIQNTRPELKRVSFRGQEYLFDYPTYAIHNSLQLGSEACDAAR